MPRQVANRPTNHARDDVAKLLAAGLLRFHRRVQIATSPLRLVPNAIATCAVS
jgi:hypothetical protein